MFSVVNIQDPIGKQVGRRGAVRDSLAYGLGLQKTLNELRRSFGHAGLCPKGVHRFKTHEEADQWERRMMARRQTLPS